MIVEWKVKGFFKADAEKVYSEITALGETFSPETVIEAAKDKNSELHKCFTWNNTKAANNWRKHEARVVMSNLVVVTETTDNEPVAVRLISSTSVRNEYKPTVMLIESETEYADLLARAIRELKAFQKKYETVTELREIFGLINEL